MADRPEYSNEVTEKALSSGVSELMSDRPSWIVRKGNTIFLLMGCCFVFLCWIIKYPIVIKGTVTFLPSTSSPQTHLQVEIKAAPADGNIIKQDQRVQMKLLSSAGMEVVYLAGRITYISPGQHANDSFIIKADFPNTPDSIAFSGWKPPAPAEIIVGNRRVLSNVTEQLKKMVHN